MIEYSNEKIGLNDLLTGYVPDSEDRAFILKTRDIFAQFVSSLGPGCSCVINDSLSEVSVSFCLSSDYRGRHLIEFLLVCSLVDGVYIEAKFNTPKLFEEDENEEKLARELSEELHSDELIVHKDSSRDMLIAWSLVLLTGEDEVSEQLLKIGYDRLAEASVYIIRKMETAYWEKFSMNNLSPDKIRSEHITYCKLPHSYEVFEGITNTGKRALFIESDYGELYIDTHDSVKNKVYIGHFFSYPVGPDEETEDATETFEAEIYSEDKFRIVNTTKGDRNRTGVVAEGGRINGSDFMYCRFKEYNDHSSICIIAKDTDGIIRIFEFEDDDEINEVARVEKNYQVNPYIDADETQYNVGCKIRTRYGSGNKIAFIYAISLLSL